MTALLATSRADAAPVRGAAAPRRRISPERVAAGLTLMALAAASVIALANVGISVPDLVHSWENARRFFERIGPITFPEPAELIALTALTIGIVLTGTILASLISVPIAFLAAGNTTPGPGWRVVARSITVLTRAVPDIVLAMAFALMFSLGALPGILAIGVHSIGMISKLFADAIEQIDEGPRTAVRAAGGSRLQEFTSGILPQVLPSWLATVLHRNDINLRGSVVLGYVGVAGLGLEMSYAFKSLDYSRGLGIAVVMFVLCVAMEVVSSAIRTAMLGVQPSGRGVGDRVIRAGAAARARRRSKERAATPDPPRGPGHDVESMLRRPWDRTRLRNVVWSWAGLAVVVGAALVCDIRWADFASVWAKIPAVAVQFWPPSFGSYDWDVMLEAMKETVAIALAATLLSLVASVVIGSLAARNVAPSPGVRGGARLLLVGIRGVPELILAIVLIVITGLGAQAGTIALALGGIGLLGKLIADSFEEVKRGPERAISATGATRLQVYGAATLPQGLPALLGHSFYLLDTNVRAATVLGIVGGGGIGYYLLNAGQGADYGVVTAIVLMILVVVLAIEGVAVWMRRVFR